MPRSHIYHARRGGQHLRRNAAIAASLVVVLVVAWIGFALLRSVPGPKLTLTISRMSTIGGAPLALDPTLGVEEAVALEGTGTIAVAEEESPTPIASLTKMMSALVVLRDHPLSLGENGPEITVTSADVASYKSELAVGDSVVKVQADEQLSELQLLEGALIPSGDNIIQLLATWNARSTSAFVGRMNALARTLGMDHTHYSGPSGVDPATVSTASDQLRLAEAAMANPVFAGIVAMPQVTLPVAGVQYNVDADLGSDGIDGIKTGWVPQGGGCFVFAATDAFHGRNISVVGAVLGEQGATPIPTALSAAKRLVLATEKTLRTLHLPAGSTVGTLSAPYASPVRVVTASPISLVDWEGARVDASTTAASTGKTAKPTAPIGSLTVTVDSERSASGLRTVSKFHGPSFGWRITHL